MVFPTQRCGARLSLLFVWTVLLSIASANQPQIEEVAKIRDLPKNITDFYHGFWNSNDDTSTQSLTRLGFDKVSGAVLASVHSMESGKDAIHLVKGEFDLGNGNYSTVTKLRFEFQGALSTQSGLMFIILNPKDAIQIYNYSLVIDADDDIDNVLQTTFDVSMRNGSTYVPSSPTRLDPESCAFKGLFRVSLMPDVEPSYFDFDAADATPRQLHLISGEIRSVDCRVSLRISSLKSMPFNEYASQARRYVGAVFLSSVFTILAVIAQMNYTPTTASISRVSMLSIAQHAIIDCFLCLTHLLVGLVGERVFNAFALLAFLNFVGFSIFEMRYLLMVWKARRPQNANGSWDSIRNELSMLYLQFYGALIFIFVLLYYVSSLFTVFLFLAYSFWVPQIVSNVRRDSSKPLLVSYVLTMSLMRLVTPAYFLLVDPNFARIEPHPPTFFWLSIWVAIQALLLLAQYFFGPRFFVPKVFLPIQYDYMRQPPATVDPKLHHVECVICMNKVDEFEASMVTPCNHIFHRECLMRWLEFKLECPTCRRGLPAPPASLTRLMQADGPLPTDDSVV